MSLELNKVSFGKDALTAAPKEEQRLFILAGQFLNELATLGRLVAWTAAYSSDDATLATGGMANKLTILNYTVSKLYEGWKLIEKRFTPELRLKYFPKFNLNNAASYAVLAKYFSDDKNRIKKIRNNFGFHNYDEHELIFDTFSKFESARFTIYMNEAPGQCLYDLSIQSIALCLVEKDRDNFEQAFGVFLKEVRQVAEHMQFLLFDYQCCFISEYINKKCERTKVVFENLPDQNSVQIPYFTSSWK